MAVGDQTVVHVPVCQHWCIFIYLLIYFLSPLRSEWILLFLFNYFSKNLAGPKVERFGAHDETYFSADAQVRIILEKQWCTLNSRFSCSC